jgi:hypothetical protein
MKNTTVLAIALGVGALAACNQSPKEQTADNIEANAENVADTIEANADNATDVMEANAQNAADEVRADGENKADAVREGADATATATNQSRSGRSHAGRPKAPRNGAPFSLCGPWLGNGAPRFILSEAQGTTSRTPAARELPRDVRRDWVVDGDQATASPRACGRSPKVAMLIRFRQAWCRARR